MLHVVDKTTAAIDATSLQIGAAILESRIAESQGRTSKALEALGKAVHLQDSMPYSEPPPPWFYPVRESLGALLLRVGQADEAEAVFRMCLRMSPNDPRALLGLSEALRARGQKSAAGAERANFAASWRFSDGPVSLGDL